MAPSGHRRNPFSVILFLAVVVVVVVVVNKLEEPNTAVFGINSISSFFLKQHGSVPRLFIY